MEINQTVTAYSEEELRVFLSNYEVSQIIEVLSEKRDGMKKLAGAGIKISRLDKVSFEKVMQTCYQMDKEASITIQMGGIPERMEWCCLFGTSKYTWESFVGADGQYKRVLISTVTYCPDKVCGILVLTYDKCRGLGEAGKEMMKLFIYYS